MCISHGARYTRAQGASKTKNKQNKKDQKAKSGEKRPTGFPFVFVLFLGTPCVGCGHATAYGHPQLAVGCGVFLYELVPSGDPFIYCLCETFFLAAIFFQRIFLLSGK
jgi:ribosomal protein S27E